MKYLIWMRETAGLSAETCNRLLEHFGTAEAVYRADVKQLKATGLLQLRTLRKLGNRSLRKAQQILERCRHLDIQVMSIFDEAYPHRLRSIFDPPVVLYIRGKLPQFNHLPAITVVGSRSATPYGLMTAEKLGYQLSESGFIVVSGLADGIDGASQEGAVKGRMPTVAVLGTAIDVCYPRKNIGLMRRILQNGAVISEYPPGKMGSRAFFPQRNRIMSGLSLGTVVVEAPKKSGALITASLALDQGRDVFAVPGDIHAKASEGTNNLIKAGTAKLITQVEDIITEYAGPLYGLRMPQEEAAEQAAPPKEHRPAGRKLAEVYQPPEEPAAAPQQESDPILALLQNAMHIDEITEKSGLSQGQVTTMLTLLELQGKVRQLPNKYFEKT